LRFFQRERCTRPTISRITPMRKRTPPASTPIAPPTILPTSKPTTTNSPLPPSKPSEQVTS